MNADGARMIASPVWRVTTLSNAGMLPTVKFPEKCFEIWSHQAGLENLCMIATPQRSRRTDGMHVGSANGSAERSYPSQKKVNLPCVLIIMRIPVWRSSLVIVIKDLTRGVPSSRYC